MSHTFKIEITDEEFRLVQTALYLKKPGPVSDRAVGREVAAIVRGYIEDVYGTDKSIVGMIESVERFQKRRASGLTLIDGGEPA